MSDYLEVKVTKSVLLIEIGGSVYQVVLPKEEMEILVQLAKSLSGEGPMKVLKRKDFKFT